MPPLRSKDLPPPRRDDTALPGPLFDRMDDDELGEEMGENFVSSATSGEEVTEEVRNQDVPEDEGGPFVESTATEEFADGVDASNPDNATREAFPTATAEAEEEEEEN